LNCPPKVSLGGNEAALKAASFAVILVSQR
jgi:hypothetical protein